MISSPMAVRVEQTNAEDDGNQMAEIFRMTSSSYWWAGGALEGAPPTDCGRHFAIPPALAEVKP